MKHKHYFLPIFLLSLFLFACQTNEDELFRTQQGNLTFEEGLQSPVNDNMDFFAIEAPEVSNFKIKMHWASFVTERILFYDDEDVFRSSFLDLLDSGNNIIPLEDIIGEHSVLPAFSDAFENLYLTYINNDKIENNCGRPEGSEDYPRRPTSRTSINSYFQYMLVDNCVELYFPNGLEFNSLDLTALEMTSTFHPLTNATFNKGIKRFYIESCIYTDVVTVDADYVAANANIILARPYRLSTAGEGRCAYNDYDFDFTDFLSGE